MVKGEREEKKGREGKGKKTKERGGGRKEIRGEGVGKDKRVENCGKCVGEGKRKEV